MVTLSNWRVSDLSKVGTLTSSNRNHGHGGKFKFKRQSLPRPTLQRPKLFSIVCAECGSHAEVSFKPTQDRPVLCSSCHQERIDKERALQEMKAP